MSRKLLAGSAAYSFCCVFLFAQMHGGSKSEQKLHLSHNVSACSVAWSQSMFALYMHVHGKLLLETRRFFQRCV